MINRVRDLRQGDYIAFGFNYNGGKPDEVIVSNITCIEKNGSFLCHFLYGYHSLAEFVKPEDVLAIGDMENGTHEIKGWSGKFILIQPNNELLN